MIESIRLKGVASYCDAEQQLQKLTKFTYIYGGNGAGKTTISRLIADPNHPQFSQCGVGWKRGSELECRVYNRDFVKRNFQQTDALKGVFTLGEAKIADRQKIDDAIKKRDEHENRATGYRQTLETKEKELERLSDDLADRCWEIKLKYQADFREAFQGCMASKAQFRNKVLVELAANGAITRTEAELKLEAKTVYGANPTAHTTLPDIDFDDLDSAELDLLLGKCIVGKSDVAVADLIERLGNSDWVRRGQYFHEKCPETCPFCQQAVPANLASELAEYFDDQYLADIDDLEGRAQGYRRQVAEVHEKFQAVIGIESPHLNRAELESAEELFRIAAQANLTLLADKLKEPSRKVSLEPTAAISEKAAEIIQEANEAIEAHNALVADLTAIRARLTAEIWRYLLDNDLKGHLATYSSSVDPVKSAISSLEAKILEDTREAEEQATLISELETSVTSIKPTFEAINKLLKSFAFTAFELRESDTPGCYKIVRPDGTDVQETLSEGEMSFITFLYFFELLKGSSSEGGVSRKRIVVFDDPVSSLDGDVLFLVSSLIRGLCEEVEKDKGNIKQVFVLTHNVYFHREVTFRSSSSRHSEKHDSFWVIRKADNKSLIVSHRKNPIKSGYDLLWSDLREPVGRNSTIQNTMRRILENYFKIMGGVDYERCVDEFEGEHKIVGRALCSWVNDGSHNAQEELYVAPDDDQVQKFQQVFRMIFEKTGHLEHYKMMMKEEAGGTATEESPTAVVAMAAGEDKEHEQAQTAKK